MQEKGRWNLNSSGSSLIPSSPWSPINSSLQKQMILIPFSTTAILAPLPLQTIFPVLMITFPLFLMSADFPRKKKKSYHTAEGAVCYVKQILICIIVAPISVLA